MREAEVRALLVDPATRSPVLLLKDRNSTKAMPIWIAEPEAMSIALELQGQRFPRPLPHDLMKELLAALGASLEQVVITQIKDGVFYAKLVIRDAQGAVKELDSRPSDAIALALRTRSPIFIAEEVFEQAAIESPFAEEEQFEKFVEQEFSLAEIRRRVQGELGSGSSGSETDQG
ncbi:MAG: bifunctional nuclease family protein [Candidatus Bipolaricaulota bacterium]|nr:bifunctional nuclease family protein [Candidatus Bipolaricaulota bacterium]MCX7843860.1 bifunctional nuclease family protein [Candidatus Bipolaricaulota bacterium]MDW8151442.1 bifunctional nuclease family protein [Candidatus Bipolaricaulota bacterium]